MVTASEHDNVVVLDLAKQAQQASPPADTDAVPDFIKPHHIGTMSATDADLYLSSLRDRRLRAAQQIAEAKQAKQNIANIASRDKVERKIAQVARAAEKADVACEKLEELVFQMRALQLQLE